MTNKERQELFEALSGYYPYGVLTEHNGKVYPVYNVYNDGSFIVGNEHSRTSGEIDKMYLRPMSSMNDEEKRYYSVLENNKDYFSINKWLNAKHFDHRGLIPRGLALEAKEEMYAD